LRDPENLFYLGGAALLLAYLGAVLGLGVAVLLLAVRARGSFAHDLLERLPGRLSAASAPIAGAAILALPLALPVPITWALSFWGALLVPYLRGVERLLVVLTLLTLVGAGLFGAAVAWHLDTATDPTARALLQAASTGADLRHEVALKRALREHPDDPLYPFLLGSAYRLGGRPEEAMAMYRRVLTIDPSNARAMVNLGNLFALRQEFAQAHALYKKAGETDPRMALARFDSHLAYLERFEMESADAELKEARRIDPALIDSLLQGTNEGAARRAPLDARYPAAELWGRALRLRRQPTAVTARAAAANPAALGGLAGIVALLVLPGLLLAPRHHPAGQCGRCGGAYCRKCQVATKFPGYCSPCVHLFLLRDGLAPSVREAKMDEVVRFRKRLYLRTRVLSLFLPGSGHVLGGRPLLGGIFLSFWAAAWAGLVLRRRLLVPPGTLPGVATVTALVALAVVALTAWLLANLTRQERKDEV
ncbi:MAG TPA: tetratricopeptide repeat protein, partial [Dongiaceae bacterium]|nr:tetratricopeptide repeat protein [Dongiaceae bacterium]